MDKFIQLTEKEQRLYYEQAAEKLNLPAPAIEKDFWVEEKFNGEKYG